MINQKLNQELEYVRKTFFPRWDKGGEWRIRRFWHLPCRGKYDTDSKTILLRSILENKDDLHHLLIHEICHCASNYHGKRYQDRYLKAKTRAEEIGREGLVKKMIEELSMLRQKNDLLVHRYVYQQIADWTLDRPEIPLKKMLTYVAREKGMYLCEFLKRYKRAKEVCLSGKAFAREEKKNRKRFEELRKEVNP